MPKAGKDQVVIKNHAVAVNPVDWKIQDYDFFVKYPTVLGTDVAGEVHEVGEGVTHVKKGDRVLGHAHSLIASNPEEGGLSTILSLFFNVNTDFLLRFQPLHTMQRSRCPEDSV